MKLKVMIKAIAKAAEVMAVFWSVGVCVGAGFRAGEKMEDFVEECYWEAVKSHNVRRCRRKILKLSKKEKLTEDEKKQQKDLLAEQMWWQAFDTQQEATLGTKIVGDFGLYHMDKEDKE